MLLTNCQGGKPFDNDRLLSVIRNAFRFRESELQKRKMNEEIQSLSQKIEMILAEMEETLEQSDSPERMMQFSVLIQQARKLL